MTAAIGSMYDFFLSYSSWDEAKVKAYYDALVKAGASVFLDIEKLAAGDRWDVEIRRAQRSSKATVVFVSSRSGESWYDKEEIAQGITQSRNGDHRVIPVLLDRVDELYGLQRLVSVKAYELRLNDAVVTCFRRSAAGRPRVAAVSVATKTAGAGSRRKRVNWTAIAAVAGVAVALVALLFGNGLLLGGGGSASDVATTPTVPPDEVASAVVEPDDEPTVPPRTADSPVATPDVPPTVTSNDTASPVVTPDDLPTVTPGEVATPTTSPDEVAPEVVTPDDTPTATLEGADQESALPLAPLAECEEPYAEVEVIPVEGEPFLVRGPAIQRAGKPVLVNARIRAHGPQGEDAPNFAYWDARGSQWLRSFDDRSFAVVVEEEMWEASIDLAAGEYCVMYWVSDANNGGTDVRYTFPFQVEPAQAEIARLPIAAQLSNASLIHRPSNGQTFIAGTPISLQLKADKGTNSVWLQNLDDNEPVESLKAGELLAGDVRQDLWLPRASTN